MEKIDLKTTRVNLEELTKQIESIDSSAVVTREGEKIVLHEFDEKKELQIKAIIENHNPEYSDEEKMQLAERSAFDAKVLESLIRLGYGKTK